MNVEVKRRWAGQDVDLRPPAASFVDALSELMEGDDRVVALASDETYRIGLSRLEEEFSDRVLNGGAAEQNLIGMAAGMAAVGKIPVVVMPGISASALAGGRGQYAVPDEPRRQDLARSEQRAGVRVQGLDDHLVRRRRRQVRGHGDARLHRRDASHRGRQRGHEHRG